jgi:hypothetical protein
MYGFHIPLRVTVFPLVNTPYSSFFIPIIIPSQFWLYSDEILRFINKPIENYIDFVSIKSSENNVYEKKLSIILYSSGELIANKMINLLNVTVTIYIYV